MNTRVTAIIEQASKLTADERRELFDRLDAAFWDERSDGTAAEIEAAWVAEVERRIASAERGEAAATDHDKLLEELRGRLARR